MQPRSDREKPTERLVDEDGRVFAEMGLGPVDTSEVNGYFDNRLTSRSVIRIETERDNGMSPKPDVSEERRAQIVDAAMKVFARLGFKGSRMDDIVKESGLSKGLLYWYFKSKDAIIVAVIERLFAPEIDHVSKIAASDGTVSGKLRAVAHDAVRDIRTMNRLLPITIEYYSYAFRNKAVKKVLLEAGEQYYAIIQSILEEGIASGELRKVDARKTALSFGAMLEGTLLLGVFAPKMVDFAEQIESSAELLIAGLEPRPGT